MKLEIVCIAIVAVFWGGWPLVSRAAGYGGPFASLVLSLAALVPITLLSAFEGAASRPSLGDSWKLLVAGTMMGIGTVAFNYVANSEIDASVSVPVIDAAMLLVTTTGAVWFFGESLPPQKIAGIGLLLAGIVLLRPS